MIQLATALQFDRAMRFGGAVEGVKPSLRSRRRVGVGRGHEMLGSRDDRSGLVEGVALAEPVESFGDTEPRSVLDGEAGVEAAFDVEGEPEPGVAGCG